MLNDSYVNAETIRQYRESKGLTQSQFAALLRVSTTAVTHWEKGQVPSGPASLLLEHLVDGVPIFSSGGGASDWDVPLNLKEWEELERRRARNGFLTVRDYLLYLVRQDIAIPRPGAASPAPKKASGGKSKKHAG
ncbi:MAG: helix-turn-helix protein [Verrucomicrobiaceae bacterium]|nr:helix-turn-helix protein [Verrucomicrobiaceae bacterium]